MINAVIATEDRSFWTNDGIDLGAVFRAFLTNVTSGRIEQGGSTITQQLVKNRHPHVEARREPQDQGDRGRPPAEREVLEGQDPRRVPEHRVLRARTRTASRPPPPRFFTVCDNGCPFGPRGKNLERAHDRRDRAPRRAHLEPRGQQPVHPPRPRHPPPRRRAAGRGRTGLHHPGRGRRRQPGTAADGARRRRRPVRPTSSPPRCRTACSTTPASGNTEKERLDKLLQGRAEDLHDLRPEPAAMAIDATNNAKPQKGADWASSLVAIDPSTGAVKAMVAGQTSPTASTTSPPRRTAARPAPRAR